MHAAPTTTGKFGIGNKIEEVQYSPLEITHNDDDETMGNAVSFTKAGHQGLLFGLGGGGGTGGSGSTKNIDGDDKKEKVEHTDDGTGAGGVVKKIGTEDEDEQELQDDEEQGIEMCLTPPKPTVKERIQMFLGSVSATGRRVFSIGTTTATTTTTPGDHPRDKVRKRRRRLICAAAAILVLLLVVIVGSVCGSGHCGGGGGGGARGGPSGEASSVSSGGNSGSATSQAGDLPDAEEPEPEPSQRPPPPPQTPTSSSPPSITTPESLSEVLGPHVTVIDPTWSVADIQSKFDAVFRLQQNNEMGTERFALYFWPGVYGSPSVPLMLQIGYYTDVAGLGATPDETVIYGKVEVYNRCFEPDPYDEGKFIPTADSENGLCFALNSFWRSMSNLQVSIVTPAYQDQCRATAMFWAISQASSMRRVHVANGDMSLMDYCSNPAYASGGFIADSKAEKIISGSQQQFLTRNSDVIREWDGSVWNQMFVGVTGNVPDDSTYPDPPVTVIRRTPVSREKPFLYVSADNSNAVHVFVPDAVKTTRGVSWENGLAQVPGRSIPLREFHVAWEGDESGSPSFINQKLSSGTKYLLLTPGVYDVDETIVVRRADAVVKGIGQATLTAVDGAVPLEVLGNGAFVAGVTIDAGAELSPALLRVGRATATDQGDGYDPENPITLSDVYFRLGGPHVGKADVCLEVNADFVLIDHTWVWRGDHGVEGFDSTRGFEGDDIRWVTNIGKNGVVVNGSNVTATGLFVEHFQEHNVVWNGEGGQIFFFQNELPYDPPSQEEWTMPDATLGWAAYKVNDDVDDHLLWGGGVYCYNRNDPNVVTERGFEVPSKPDVTLRHVYTINLSGPGSISNVVNDVGETVDSVNRGPSYVDQYPTE